MKRMKIHLLPQNINWYRANLHCHTTISDGHLTPEQVKDLYKSRGYSIVAYSDHERYVPHPELNDASFLALPSVECAMDINNGRTLPVPPGMQPDWALVTCFHFNLFARDAATSFAPIRKTIWGAQHNQFDGTAEERRRMGVFSYEIVNDFIRVAREAGFLVQLNHPYWSLNTMEDCLALDNLWSLEILNWATQRATAASYCPDIYEQMLWKYGPSLFCTMDDDNHNSPLKAPEESSFGGSTFIAAGELSHEAVIAAMERGDFFCASGLNPPRFHALWVEDGKIHAEFSPVSVAICTGYGRRYKQVRGGGITSATFDLLDNNPYFRLSLIDGDNNYANTNAYAIRDEWRAM